MHLVWNQTNLSRKASKFDYSGVSRRLRRLAGIETAFVHQNGPTRPPPFLGAQFKKWFIFISLSTHPRKLKSSHVKRLKAINTAHNVLRNRTSLKALNRLCDILNCGYVKFEIRPCVRSWRLHAEF